MAKNLTTTTQTCTIQKSDSGSELVMDILKRHSDLYAEAPENIYGYFELLLKNEKPAVSIEIYSESAERVLELKSSLERFFFVFGGYNNEGRYPSSHLSVSRIESVARYLDMIENEGFAKNAGIMGILMGHSLNEVTDYLKRTKEDRLKG